MSDSLHYADLGKVFWTTGRYALDGIPYANHLPFHAVLSYPLTAIFGIELGMHLSTLLGGIAVICVTFCIVRHLAPREIAVFTVLAVLFHPAFVLMSQLGSADLLFTALSLFSILFYLRAKQCPLQYLWMGLCLGLACLTRYNGLPLFAVFFLWTVLFRRRHVLKPEFVSGLLLALTLAGIWFVRNYIVFGNPLHSNYVGELAAEAPNPFMQLLKNIIYYGNPVHNVFPFLFPFALFGFVKYARRYSFITICMFALWLISSIWWVQAIRFFFPGYPLLLFFTVLGVRDFFKAFQNSWLPPLAIAAGLFLQTLSLCLYSYGACNAMFDKTVGLIPGNMGLTPEGFYAWGVARDFINTSFESGTPVFSSRPDVEKSHFRSGLVLTEHPTQCVSYYAITQHPEPTDVKVFETEVAPVTYVVNRPCAQTTEQP